MVNPLIFREYDIRGIADTELTDEVVFDLGRGFGTYIAGFGMREAIIGRDVRLSSERIRDSLVEGLRATGCDVVDVGLVPTPVCYFSFYHYDKNCGVMITGSHNPKEYNGFKVLKDKTSIYGQEIQTLRRVVEEGKFNTGKGKLTTFDPIPAYIEMVKSKVKIKSGLKVVFDPANGTAGVLLEKLFSELGVEGVYINLEPDGNFPVHLPDPTIPEYLVDLQSLVLELHADVGIGYDGDGDRIGAVDENGTIVFGDKLLGVFSKEVIGKIPKAKVIFDVKCSQGLVEYITAIGGVPVMSKTGHSLIKARMKAELAPLAGEMSGHMFFAENYYGYDDALFASARLLRIIADAQKPLSALVAEIPCYYSTPEIRVDCPDEIKFEVVKDLAAEFKSRYETIDIDGVRVVFSDGWGLLRASNTQPVLVLRFEAKTEERLAGIRDLFFEKLSKYIKIS
jgi:phosphomannomutase/phosphoglucomutase